MTFALGINNIADKMAAAGASIVFGQQRRCFDFSPIGRLIYVTASVASKSFHFK